MRRRIGSLALALLFISGLMAACGQSSIIQGSGDVHEGGPPAKEELVVWHTYSEEETRVFEDELIPDFERQYPNIVIRAVRQPHNDQLKSTIVSRATSDKVPDVVRMDIAWVPEMARLGVLYPVSDFADFGSIVSSLRPDALPTNRYGGRYYGLPLNITTKIAIYNRKLMEQAGLSRPPQTVEELFEAASRNRMVIGIEGTEPWQLLSYFTGLGGKLMNDAYTKASGYLNSPESVRAMSRLLELYQQGTINPELLTGKMDRWNSLIAGTNTLMIDEGPWFYSILSNFSGNSYNLSELTVAAPFPGTGDSIVGGENLVILKSTKHLEAAWTFLKWMTSKEAEHKMSRTGQLPTNLETEAIETGNETNQLIQVSKESLTVPLFRPPIPQWLDMEEIWNAKVKMIFSGQISVQIGLDEAATAFDALLK